ncbi:hypothetical protein HK104_010285 [Borealophlyctis nickersoniae]|nr:hypothetical protein HK104_010285 [Borealophlyctis nickersoniae]
MSTESDLHDILRKGEIIPDVISDFKPTVVVTAACAKGPINYGNEFEVSDMQFPPSVSWVSSEPGSPLHLLVMVDPDAPSRDHPKNRLYRHWAVANIKGDDIATATELTPYMPPAPPEGSGPHRYVLLLFRQPGDQPMTFDVPKERGKWNATAFKEEYGVVPVGANWFVSRRG